jgi:hypothetical protein
MDHAAMVMVLQAIRDVNTELQAVRQALDRLTQASEPSREIRPSRSRPPRTRPRTVEFPRPVDRTRTRKS